MGLEEEIANSLAEELRRGIDNELMADMMVACGWTKVRTSVLIVVPTDREDWCKENCIGAWKKLDYNWLFERVEDATMFTLRWS